MTFNKKPISYGLKSILRTNLVTQEEQLKFLQELAKRQMEDQMERMKRPLYKKSLSLLPWVYN